MEITLLARSSSSDRHYKVAFVFEDEKLSVHCDCQAGAFGRICNHKLALLDNDSSMLYEAEQKDQLAATQEWVKQTGYPSFLTELREAESGLGKNKKELKRLKNQIEKAIKNGLGK